MYVALDNLDILLRTKSNNYSSNIEGSLADKYNRLSIGQARQPGTAQMA